jgi:hypothetical protein
MGGVTATPVGWPKANGRAGEKTKGRVRRRMELRCFNASATLGGASVPIVLPDYMKNLGLLTKRGVGFVAKGIWKDMG